jgi:hypothetical protein
MAGRSQEASEAHQRLADVLDAAEYPNLTLRALARRLGRNRSRLIGIEPEVVEFAIREPVLVA